MGTTDDSGVAAQPGQTGGRRRLEVSDVTVVRPEVLRRTLAGTIVGNLMEWYDIGVYGYLAVIIGRMFLPGGSTTAQNLFSLGVFAVTFIARPLGGVVLGQFGDRMGRQKVLAFTLLMMASATFLIGILPDYAKIGFWAPILLIVLKLLQGFSTGGEYAGATTFLTEFAPDRRRGFLASLLDVGSYLGFASGAAVVSVLQLTLSPSFMEGWGWRIPFMLALPFGVVALYFRSRIEETPAFQEAQKLQESEAATGPRSVRSLIGAFWREILVAITLVAAANTAGYALTSYMPTYLTSTLGYDETHGTLLTLPVLVVMSLCIPLAGALSDRIGRRTVLRIASVGGVVLAIPAFLLMMHGVIWSTLLGLFVLSVPVALYVSNLASCLPALFPTSSRYGGMGISYNVAAALFSGTAPFIMEALVAITGEPLAPAFWVILTSVAGFIAIFFLPESARRPLPAAMPAVSTPAEAQALVDGQDDNPDLDVDELFRRFDEERDVTTSGSASGSR
ncbi:MFS transporter [Acidipropionibacterium jensenii]|uniref:Putative proline/betaine transporter n=1 Tax=Acidipropionibacterium jensenii TaxID=1749 RepID=A0A3Q9ULP1_9ACTN|nr:MFS transporter [Acidipropionibacterium jensenii]AZZ39923.1 MFS transporter [Acidipropionibacterium jensenii]